MYGPADLDHIKPGSTYQPAKFRRRAEHGRAPCRIAQPAAKAAAGGPEAPAPEFADHKPPAGLQDASHFRKRSFGISNEAKHGHRNDTVENCIVEWQPRGLSLSEMQLSPLDFGATPCGSDHRRISVESCYDCSVPSQFGGKCSVAAADIQQRFVRNRANEFEKKLLLQPISNLAKAARSPMGIRLGKPFC